MSAQSGVRNIYRSIAATSEVSLDAEAGSKITGARLPFVLAKVAVIEFIIVAGIAYLASEIYHAVFLLGHPPVHRYGAAALSIAILVLLVSLNSRDFAALQTQPRRVFLLRGTGAVGIAFSLFLTAMFLLKITEDYSRGAFVFQIASVALALLIERAVTYAWFQSAIAAGQIQARRIVLIGDAERCLQASSRMKSRGIHTLGTFRFPQGIGRGAAPGGDHWDDAAVRTIIEGCRRLRPDDIILLGIREPWSALMGFASAFSELPVSFNVAPMDSLDRPLASQVAMFDDLLTIQVHRPPLSLWDRSIKRTFDIVAAAIGLILLLPLFIAVSVAIKLDSRGPIFFRQTRHGFNNEAIRVFKFRSMTTTENGDDFTQVVKNDPRVTRIGRILRATNIDELPQLINVLLGSMSIVGPRPHATAHNEIFLRKIPPLSRRHNVKPGITGWAQVNGFRGETDTIEKMQKRIDHDLQYIDNWSFMFDMKIIMMTLFSKKAYVNAY